MRSIFLLPFVFFILFLLSWIANFVKLTDCDFQAPYRCEIIHGAGIIPPIAPIAVWFGTDKDTQ
jgi:hypothetical protein